MTGNNNYNLTERLFLFAKSEYSLTYDFDSNDNFSNI